jgi:hypothetical protein
MDKLLQALFREAVITGFMLGKSGATLEEVEKVISNHEIKEEDVDNEIERSYLNSDPEYVS